MCKSGGDIRSISGDGWIQYADTSYTYSIGPEQVSDAVNILS